ncbi:hypothetical protein CPAST_c30490 [Clostridium pasteurianum DSM 525 = ATCC 6013]|uniref:Uncharacterized protein n=1 Tax=Clostridium pasteurianum DSM 525 = ATCC 6013 TaxID=1262449 RepID=A0A0H3JB50_CLOPA|nr:hypothetical protein [Clostridium pasteurianum]AJA49115.1 hypothetical protein CPAST_c30490 [Clostridium pasteurianum DSM 525 = ATCC 6013]AJA53103.1 hypothetical protein CLPA_c30490 [Clostridium pasteurianum DSM 525 = ATCC 6013]AOZ76310.1 hypothetical protein AQ983_14815 [Clostridium pasteurianum DSM 525 = ATCC 6013]AOZ80107.1 hypothetical protein AQ984_14810 [Clostridium pasteurianum]ELP59050.1 hypothetical protein F502_11191 [Clostridium pasteurianum DSM 525 = ATCC 6013]
MSNKKKTKKHKNNTDEIWSEEQYEEYLKELYGMEFIAGFTENALPYGLFKEDREKYTVEESDNYDVSDDELPF